MTTLKRILLAEDDPKDIELTLTALEEYNLVNEVVTARDGGEVLDYLYRRGDFAQRPKGNPILVTLHQTIVLKKANQVGQEEWWIRKGKDKSQPG